MKKLLSLLLLLVCANALQAEIYKAYVNPLKMASGCGVSNEEANNVYSDFITGFSVSKSVVLTIGDKNLSNSELANKGFDYAITITMKSCKVEQKESTIDAIAGLFSSSKKETKKYYEAETKLGVYVYNLKNNSVYKDKVITTTASKEERDEARNESLSGFDVRGTRFVDNNFPIYAKIVSAEEVNKKNEVKTVIIDKGSSSGVRKNLMFDILEKQNGKVVNLGKARVEMVRGPEESVLSVYGTKDGDQKIFYMYTNDLISNLQLKSRANEGISLFRSDERSTHFPTDHNRKVKPRVAMTETKNIGGGDSNDLENLAKGIKGGLTSYSSTTITPVSQQLTMEQAAAEGVDAVIRGAFRGLKRNTDVQKWKDKNGNEQSTTYYVVTLTYSVSAYNAKTHALISKKDLKSSSRSEKGYDEAYKSAFNYVKGDVSEFICNTFPVEGWILSIDKMKKGKASMATIDIGSSIGVSEDMKFDIYRQQKNGGVESRELLGEASVKKIDKNTTSVKIKGNKDGNKRIAEIYQNASGEETIVLISRYARKFLGLF